MLIPNLILFLDYDVILRLHDSVMMSFLVFFSISKTTCVRIVGVAPNDAEYMIFYLSSIHYLLISRSENDLIQKNVFFCIRSYATIPQCPQEENQIKIYFSGLNHYE